MNSVQNDHPIDVRPIVPRERHPLIFNTWESLPEGDSLLIINDHDPLPLYYQFAAEYGGTFQWRYLECGPEVWRVSITRGDFADPGFVPAARTPARCAPVRAVPIEFSGPCVVDARPILARGEHPCDAIDQAVAGLIPGQRLVLLAPFEPVPLCQKLERQGFRNQARCEADGTWRVEFWKP